MTSIALALLPDVALTKVVRVRCCGRAKAGR